MNISTAARNALAAAIAVLLDAGSGPGTIKLYTGTKPAGPGTAVTTQTLLGTLTLSDPAFGSPSNGVVAAGTIIGDSTADATGTATWFRAADSNGLAVIDGTVGTSGAELILDTTSIIAGGAIVVESWTITAPAS